MEGEINKFILVWSLVLSSLYYSHTIGKILLSCQARFLAILPVICLFLYLPLHLNAIYFTALTPFFTSWLANFKLMLFAFNKGPLHSHPPMSMSRFFLLACLPIGFREQSGKKTHKSPLNYVAKSMLLAMIIRSYEYKPYINEYIIWAFYSLHIYLALELVLAIVSGLVKTLAGLELEPTFNDPYLSTSLQDFWGKRWNLMVTKILHVSVYDPVMAVLCPLMERKKSALVAVLATFLVSGLMHELIFYYMERQEPSGQVTCFFLLHGISLCVEMVVKRSLKGRFALPRIVAAPLVVGYVTLTAFWLFLPPFLATRLEVKACKESLAFLEFVKHGRVVSPTSMSCRFFL